VRRFEICLTSLTWIGIKSFQVHVHVRPPEAYSLVVDFLPLSARPQPTLLPRIRHTPSAM